MPSHAFQSKLKRILCQVQYRPNLSWFNDRTTIAQQFEDKYKEWNTSQGNVALYSPDERKALEIFTNTLSYLNETEVTIDECEKQVSSVLGKLIKNYNIKELRRIGFRRTEVMSSKFEFTELVELLYQKFYLSTKELQELQTGKVNDLSFVLDTMDRNINTHVQIGAVKKAESEKLFAKDTKFLQNQTIDTENNLFIDIDVSISTDLKAETSIEDLKKIIKRNEETFKKYLDYLAN
jgi:hypothetical protein